LRAKPSFSIVWGKNLTPGSSPGRGSINPKFDGASIKIILGRYAGCW